MSPIEKMLINRCFMMACKHNICPDSSRDDIKQAIEYSHDKGYLYTNRSANAFVCGYRIPELNDKWKTTIPDKEQGEIFFVNFAVSEDLDKWTLLRMLRAFLKSNPDVKELCYYRRNSEKDFKQIHLRRASHGK